MTYNTLGNIVEAEILTGSSIVINSVEIDYDPYGETTFARQLHSGSVDHSANTTTPYAYCEYEGLGTAGGHSIVKRSDWHKVYKERNDEDGTEICAVIDYDYEDADGVQDML